MSLDNRPFDWVRFWVHFVFGAVFGAIAGLYWALGADTFLNGLLITSGMALFVGLLAGLWGDRFWESFGEWWNPFRWF